MRDISFRDALKDVWRIIQTCSKRFSPEFEIIVMKSCNKTTFSVSFLNEILFLLYFLLNKPLLIVF